MPRILVVEDEALLAIHVEFLLEGNGHEAEVCSNGRLALEKIPTFLPDLILTDYMMPSMDGLELIASLRANPETQDIPIILMTAISRPTLDAQGIRHDHYLSKPFVERELLDAVNAVLGIRDRAAGRGDG